MIKIIDNKIYLIDANPEENNIVNNLKNESNYEIIKINNQKRPRILIDMDDCINNFMNYLCRQYKKQTGKEIKPTDVKDWNIDKYMPGVRSIFTSEGFFESIPEKRHSISTIKLLIESKKFDVFIITACCTNHELDEKYKWFDKMLPGFNKERIIKCQEKEIIRGDVLIDDKIDNLNRCSPYMRCLLFDMPHNQECKEYPRIKRLKEALPYFEKWFGIKIDE